MLSAGFVLFLFLFFFLVCFGFFELVRNIIT